ncbi:MAG: hypothetical protein R3F55_17785 [Alphaproteobacteria bacterium]
MFALAAIGTDLILVITAAWSASAAAFFGVGAYTMGILAATPDGTALFFLDWDIGGTATCSSTCRRRAGRRSGGTLLIGLVVLRTTGVYFIMITLAFARCSSCSSRWTAMAATTGFRCSAGPIPPGLLDLGDRTSSTT